MTQMPFLDAIQKREGERKDQVKIDIKRKRERERSTMRDNAKYMRDKTIREKE